MMFYDVLQYRSYRISKDKDLKIHQTDSNGLKQGTLVDLRFPTGRSLGQSPVGREGPGILFPGLFRSFNSVNNQT